MARKKPCKVIWDFEEITAGPNDMDGQSIYWYSGVKYFASKKEATTWIQRDISKLSLVLEDISHDSYYASKGDISKGYRIVKNT